MNFTVIIKMFGIVLAAFVGLFAVLIGVLFATGGFNPPYVPLEGIYFEYSEMTIDEDTEIFVLPMPENSTELDIELSILTGNSRISLPQTAKMNEPILVEVLKDAYEQNIGGVARIRANQGLYVAECTIFIDIPVDSFEIAASIEGGIYVGDTFTVSPANIYPQKSLNPAIENLNYNMPDKVIKYYSNNTGVATVNELTGQVTLLEEGEFKIQARVIKTYNLDATQKTLDDFIQAAIEAGEDTIYAQDDYSDYMDSISVVVERTFTVQSIAVVGIEVNNNQLEPLYELDLHETHYFTPSEFGLRLLPQPDSSFTPEQLEYKLKDIEVSSMHKDIGGEFVENPNIQVTKLESPLTYEITVLEFETWENSSPYLLFYYSDELSVVVHFKVLKNDVTSITIEENAQNAIEVLLDASTGQTFDLEANTTINAVDPTKAPTYTKLVYRVDLLDARNQLNELIIDIDEETGYVTNNIITPLNRGSTRIKAFVVKTDIFGDAILDIEGNYIIVSPPSTEYVTVNVLEQLTELNAIMKKPKLQSVVLGEDLQIVIENFYDAERYALIADKYTQLEILEQTDTSSFNPFELNNHINQIALIEGQIDELKAERYIYIDYEEIVEITSTELTENTLTVNLQTLAIGKANLFIINTATKIFTDYVEIEVLAGTAGEDTVLFEFDLQAQELINLETNNPQLIRGTEGFLAFTPNSYGAFIDAYKYGKLVFVPSNPSMIEIDHSIDLNNNIIIVKIIAIGFNLNPELSYSMVRIRFVDAAPGDYLVNKKVTIDVGAVNEITLHVNSTNITAIPDEEGTMWLTEAQEELRAWVVFNNPEDPAVIGVQYISSDTSILEIDGSEINEFGNPKFIFKRAVKAGEELYLTAKSLDPFATPTDPNNPQMGAYSSIRLYVNVPEVIYEFNYKDFVGGDSEQIIAGESIDLLEEINGNAGLAPRVNVMRGDGSDYNSLVSFELEITTQGVGSVATLSDVPAMGEEPRKIIIQTQEVGINILARVRLFTDFGWETYYNIRIVPNIIYSVNYPTGLPEVVYPKINETIQIDLTDGRVSVTDRSAVPIANLKYQLINTSRDSITQSGIVTVWDTYENIDIIVRIYIEFASGVDFETFYQIEARPNIKILTDYNNSIEYQGVYYEEISFATSFNLIDELKVIAQTVYPTNDIQDISDELKFALIGTNDYITISTAGVLTYIGTPPTTDQYINILVYTDSDYQTIYRVKVLGTQA